MDLRGIAGSRAAPDHVTLGRLAEEDHDEARRPRTTRRRRTPRGWRSNRVNGAIGACSADGFGGDRLSTPEVPQ